MRKYFIASIIKHGILGGSIILDDAKMTFKTSKLTVPVELKNLEIHYDSILEITNSFKIMLPTVTVKLKDGCEYSFIIFNKAEFIKAINQRILP